MMNLMTNAAEAMRNSPRKILSVCITHPSNEEITIQISDTGSGIDPDIREHLFEPFHTTKKEGLGIGLRICRSIIEEHGGRIWLQDSSGKGTTFVFVVKTCREVANG
jgi:two-component system sensor kinase FixL